VPPLGIEFLPRFRATARALPPDRQKQVAQAVALLSDAFGRPHLHSGLGIRRLKRDYFEFRAGRDTRIVFKLEGDVACLALAGNHDDVKKFLKGV
jgi:mRNA-degrading endonuclease RelE of RelBE toxin-antitoxin system